MLDKMIKTTEDEGFRSMHRRGEEQKAGYHMAPK